MRIDDTDLFDRHIEEALVDSSGEGRRLVLGASAHEEQDGRTHLRRLPKAHLVPEHAATRHFYLARAGGARFERHQRRQQRQSESDKSGVISSRD
jgi:hypothetical protein